MTLFIDASAIVAMIAREPEATSFSDRVNQEEGRLSSAMAVWEAARSLPEARGVTFDEARKLVSDFVREAHVTLVPIGAEEAELALDAHQRYGKGVHTAKLNFGDCFAYACAKRHGAELLFKGEDFIHTDLKDAMLP